MKKAIILAGLFGLGGLASLAQQVTSVTLNPNAIITDGNLVGVQEAFNVSGLSGSIADVQLQLNIMGGFNGDLYATLVDPQGQMAVLINRPGVDASNPIGYADAGLDITLDGTAANNFSTYGVAYDVNANGQVTGTWAADGRVVSPLSTGTILASTPSTAGLSLYLGENASAMNGTWELFTAGVSDGGPFATLLSSSLSIMTVPEPGTIALAGLGSAILLLYRRKK
jgi:hypothetical protein